MLDDKKIQELFTEYLSDVKEGIISEQAKQGIRASGKSARSLRIVPLGSSGVELYGAAYFDQQEEGRAPGKFPPIESIYDWLQYKKYGITYSTDSERRSIAYAIAKKIARFGTRTYLLGGTSIIGKATEDLSPLLEKVTESVGQSIIQTVRKAYGT